MAFENLLEYNSHRESGLEVLDSMLDIEIEEDFLEPDCYV